MKAENDYKKQIRELQSALETERRKSAAMAKGLIPKEYLQNYARIQIEKDREEAAIKASVFGIGYNQIKIEQAVKDRPINLD